MLQPWFSFALIVGLVILALLAWERPDQNRCPECTHCRNILRTKTEQQKALMHDAVHKGFGWRDDSPDCYHCNDEGCPRNQALDERRKGK